MFKDDRKVALIYNMWCNLMQLSQSLKYNEKNYNSNKFIHFKNLFKLKLFNGANKAVHNTFHN